MENFARLVALDCLCEEALTDCNLRFDPDSNKLLLKKRQDTVEVSLDKQVGKITHTLHPEFFSRWSCSRELLVRPTKDLVYATAYEFLYELFDNEELHAELRSNVFRWAKKGGTLKTLSLDEAPSYEKLLVARGLIKGYVLEEYVGKHFIVTTPSKLPRLVTVYGCDCPEFQSRGQCLHHKLVSAAMEQRRTFTKHNLIQQHF